MVVKHKILFNDIQNKILSGEWFDGMLMPTENELCGIYNVSRITVRRSLEDLERLGLIKRIQGKGSLVSHKILISGENQKGFTQHLGELGIVVSSRLLKKEKITPTNDIRVKLKLQEAQKVWYFSRLRSINGKPIAVMNTYVIPDIGGEMQKYDLGESFYELYQKITGKGISHTDATVTAVNPTPEICELLQVDEGSAHILYKSIGYLPGEIPVEVNQSIFNANLYEFSVNINNGRFSKPL